MMERMRQHEGNDSKTLETFLIQAMQERHLSIIALARGSGIANQTIHAYLNGARPNLENCRKLAFFLKVPLSTIIALVYTDIEGKQLDYLIEVYLRLPKKEKNLVEGILFWLDQNAHNEETQQDT